MRSPIFTIPSGSTDSFQEHENDNTFEAEDGHEEDLLDFAVSRVNGSILDELTHVAQRARQGSSSAASTLKPQSAMDVVHRLSMGGEPSMTEEPEEDRLPDDMGSPVTVVVDAVGEEARLKANVRRYYALMELFETEKGYLNDLRVLVEVRFSFLPHHVFLPCFRPIFHRVFHPCSCFAIIRTSARSSSPPQPHVLWSDELVVEKTQDVIQIFRTRRWRTLQMPCSGQPGPSIRARPGSSPQKSRAEAAKPPALRTFSFRFRDLTLLLRGFATLTAAASLFPASPRSVCLSKSSGCLLMETLSSRY